MFPAGSEGGTSRPGRDFFRRKEVAVFSPGRSWGGQADRGKEVSEEADVSHFSILQKGCDLPHRPRPCNPACRRPRPHDRKTTKNAP